MKNYNWLVCYLFVVMAITGCRKQDHFYSEYIADGEIIYVGKLKGIRAHAGHDRLMLSGELPVDHTIQSVKVWWNDGRDSLVMPVDPASIGDSLRIMLEDLDEAMYLLQLITFDNKGNTSVRSQIEGRVYGQEYISTLLERPLGSIEYNHNRLNMEWLGAEGTAIGTEVEYTNTANVNTSIVVPPDEMTTAITDYLPGTTIRHRTLFKPDTLAIDTFYTAFEEITIDMVSFDHVDLDNDRFVEYQLPGDAVPWTGANNAIASLWSGVLQGNQSAGAWYRTADGSGIPHHFQFDLGVTTVLHEYRIWQRGTVNENNLLYANGNLRRWEIWGSTDPAEDGTFDGWVKLMDCEVIKPSGAPVGQNMPEDIAAAQAGHQFTLPEDAPYVRYIRINVLETWGETDYMFASELTFKGSYQVSQ